MTKPRRQLISLEDTPYYHIVSRCVRRAFLCGSDGEKCYEHRRQWIVDRMRLLSSLYAVDICSYAVMSNHYHIVLKLNPSESETWDQDAVMQRWLTLYKGPVLVQRFLAGEALCNAERDTVSDIITSWRKRLCDISWFMKCLNEPIARAANKEDNCTGHFWESRFKSQALLTEEALLSSMVYVDLNPIRAKIAETPETSDHTSIKERITPTFNLTDAIHDQCFNNNLELPIKPLASFEDGASDKEQLGILYSLSDYLQLADWTGRIIREDKRGAIPGPLPPILKRLDIPIEQWLLNSQQFEAVVHRRFRKIA